MRKDPDFLAISEKDVFIEARDRHLISIGDNSQNRRDAKESMLFREGLNHWDPRPLTSSSQDTPELVINFTDTLVTRVVNNMTEQELRGKCHPVGDGADVAQADTINGIGRHIEYRSEASVTYDTATDNMVTCGEGWGRLLAEYAAPDSFDQEIRIAPLMNIFSVYPDPAAIMPTACDMNWCLIVLDIPRTEYKRLYPRMDNVAWTGDSEWVMDWEQKEQIRLAEYFRIREKTATLYLIRRANGEKYTRFADEMPSPESMAAVGDVITDTRESSRRQVEWFRLNGTRVIEREVLPGSWIPLVRFQGNARNIDGRIYRRGMVKSMMDPQRMVDYGEVAKIRRLGLAPQAPWVAAEGQLDGHPEWDSSNQVAHSVLTYKPVTIMTAQGEQVLPPPQRQPPAQIEAGFAEFVQGMRSNLLAIAGMPNEAGQDNQQGQVVSGKALQRRDKLSDQSHSQYDKNRKLAIAHFWRIILEWIPHYYSEERMQRIIGDDGKPQMMKINEKMDGVAAVKNDVTVGRFDVVMDAGPSYQTKREEGSESLLELSGSPTLGPIVAKAAPDLVFRAMDFPYAEEIADRLSAQTPQGLKKIMETLPKEAKAVVQSLAGQVQLLTQELQQAQLENKYGIAKAHLAATVKAHDVEESNKTKREDTESRERTALQVTAMKVHGELAREEIGAAGKILDTHAQAGHDERAQQRMIEAGERSEKGD